MVACLQMAREGWRSAAKLGSDAYPEDITFGIGPHLRGSWQIRDGDIERELRDAAWFSLRYEAPPRVAEDGARKAIMALAARRPVAAEAVGPMDLDRFERGQSIRIRLSATEADTAEHRLHYRHVNQGERWQSVTMAAEGAFVTADIPSEYTDSRFHLQYYISSAGPDGCALRPGFSPGVSNCPYIWLPQQ
jgi:hypothetical protein